MQYALYADSLQNKESTNLHVLVFKFVNKDETIMLPATTSSKPITPDKHADRTHFLTLFLYLFTKPYRVTTH